MQSSHTAAREASPHIWLPRRPTARPAAAPFAGEHVSCLARMGGCASVGLPGARWRCVCVRVCVCARACALCCVGVAVRTPHACTACVCAHACRGAATSTGQRVAPRCCVCSCAPGCRLVATPLRCMPSRISGPCGGGAPRTHPCHAGRGRGGGARPGCELARLCWCARRHILAPATCVEARRHMPFPGCALPPCGRGLGRLRWSAAAQRLTGGTSPRRPRQGHHTLGWCLAGGGGGG